MKFEMVEVCITGPQGSGKNLILIALGDLLEKLGVSGSDLHLDDEKHTLSFPPLTREQIQELVDQ